MLPLEESIESLRKQLAELAPRGANSNQKATLVLVSKTVPAEIVAEAAKCGAADFGENKVQEMIEKKRELEAMPGIPKLRWHMIGHLQTNKVKQVLGEAVLIHSLDRLELVKEIEKQAAAKKIAEVNCLIQVNSSGEETKFGLKPEAVEAFVSQISKESAVRIKGLMTIGPTSGSEQEIREAFRKVKQLQTELKKKFPVWTWDILSMGMSGDYKIAVEEGSTMVRVGSAVFGPRPAKG